MNLSSLPYIFLGGLFLLLLLRVIVLLINKRLKSEIKYNPDSSSSPAQELLPGVEDFVKFANEIWRWESRLNEISDILSENQRDSLNRSVERMKGYFQKYGLKIIDYTGEMFNEGLNLDILDGRVDRGSMIQKTIEPAIMYEGKIIHRAKVILSQ